MIVGDDSNCIEAIKSVLPFVDGLVINHNGVDLELRKEIEDIKLPEGMKLNLLTDSWQGDFSYHRNLVGHFAALNDYDYAFVLDADEILSIDAPMGKLVGAAFVKGKLDKDSPLIVTTHNDLGNGKSESFEGVRLYFIGEKYPGPIWRKLRRKPAPAYQYIFRAHNYLHDAWTGLPPLKLTRAPDWFNIKHSGYTPSEIIKRDKTRRTLLMLSKDWAKHGHILTAFYIVREHINLNEYMSAEIWWQTVIKLQKDCPKEIFGMIIPFVAETQGWLETQAVSRHSSIRA